LANANGDVLSLFDAGAIRVVVDPVVQLRATSWTSSRGPARAVGFERFSRTQRSVGQTAAHGVQGVVKLRLHKGLRDIQIGRDFVRRPSQVMGLSNQLTVARVQLIPGFAEQFRIEQLVVPRVGSGTGRGRPALR
jgi:hypothetical protein